MNLLAIDTSTDVAALGVSVSGELLDKTTATGRSHSRDILPLIEAAIDEAGITLKQLDAIVMGQGPGSFTGLRIAAGVAQGLAYGLDIPVAPVSSMACLAQSFCNKSGNNKKVGVVVALKARLQEVYYGVYECHDGLATPVAKECVVEVTQAPPLAGAEWPLAEWIAVGDGWAFKDELQASTGIAVRETHLDVAPAVADLLTLGQAVMGAGGAVPAEQVQPVYLREKVAEKPGKRGDGPVEANGAVEAEANGPV